MTAGPQLDPRRFVDPEGDGPGPDDSAISMSPENLAGEDLDAARQRFVALWGRMASTWGISRTMAEVHAWLFIVGGGRHAEEVMDALGISRGNASMTLRRLEEWELVTRVHRRGDRKEYFEAEQDVWQMFRTILAQRKKRELDPLLEELHGCHAQAASPSSDRAGDPAGDPESADAPSPASRIHDQRVNDLANFLGLVDTIAGRLLAEDADGSTAANLLSRVADAGEGSR